MATIPSGVNGFIFASFGLSEVEVESHSWKFFDNAKGKEALLIPSSSNRSLDLRLNNLGADLGELIEQALFGDPRPSNSLMALIVWEGGEGEFMGLLPSENKFLGSLGH